MSEIILFQDTGVRRYRDEVREERLFSVVDVVALVTKSRDAAAYWRKLKQRLKVEGFQSVTNCHGFKMKAKDGKMRKTDVANTETMLRVIQSIPSPNAEPIKRCMFIGGCIAFR